MPALPKSTLTGVVVVGVLVLAGLGQVDPDAALALVGGAVALPGIDSIAREARDRKTNLERRRRRR